MVTRLLPDFSEFLSSLNESDIEYLLVGGYAVGYHGYVRATGDMDVWIRQDRANAEALVSAIRRFGFDDPDLEADFFLKDKKIYRMGLPPVRIEVMTSISGVAFDECWEHRVVSNWDGVRVPTIDLERLRKNKEASGRLKDLADLEALPDPDA